MHGQTSLALSWIFLLCYAPSLWQLLLSLSSCLLPFVCIRPPRVSGPQILQQYTSIKYYYTIVETLTLYLQGQDTWHCQTCAFRWYTKFHIVSALYTYVKVSNNAIMSHKSDPSQTTLMVVSTQVCEQLIHYLKSEPNLRGR